MYQDVVKFIRSTFGTEEFIPLHVPKFAGNEKTYLNECIDSTFVSYVGRFVTKFEEMIATFTGSTYAVAMVNGTLSLHTALLLANVGKDDEVLTQSLTFVATANAISYVGARCIFVDCEKDTLGMSPDKLEQFLSTETFRKDDGCSYNRKTGRRIAACVPVHVFGHPVRIDLIKSLCDAYNIELIEDAAESLGSTYKGKHTGTFGKMGILSFNGNKIITTGGGGMIITDDKAIAERAKHITTTAKVPHRWEFVHDEIGYNYRLPNVNAAIGCAQMEHLAVFLEKKRNLAALYKEFFDTIGIAFINEPAHSSSNFWLNGILLKNREEREKFLQYSNDQGVMTRPIWTLMHKLDMYANCQCTNLENAQWLQDRVVNLPSSVRI